MPMPTPVPNPQAAPQLNPMNGQAPAQQPMPTPVPPGNNTTQSYDPGAVHPRLMYDARRQQWVPVRL